MTNRIAAVVGRRLAAEDGFSTAELLGNAALGVLALVAIWGALQALGVDVVEMIGDWIRQGPSQG